MRSLVFLLSILFVQTALAQNYLTNSQSCYGYSRVASLKTTTDTCVGLVADKKLIPWKMPRKILFIDSHTALVTDMGGWGANNGTIWLLRFENSKLKTVQPLFTGTDRSHGIAVGPDNLIYYGDAKRIYKFSLSNPVATRKIAIDQLPDSYTTISGKTTPSSHPLSEFIFLPNGDLIANVGAPSNDCNEEFKETRSCHQRDSQAELRRFSYDVRTQSHNSNYTVIAKGLRNSMGLAYNEKTNEVMQAENSADSPGTPDELNVVSLRDSYDFGWPFCVGFGQKYLGYNNFNSFCQRQAKPPLLLFPAHAAPLSLMYYHGEMFKEYNGALITSWHGHRPTGSRIALYKTDRNHYPQVDQNKDPMSQALFLIDGWQKDPQNRHPKGRPAGLHYDASGAIFVIDDVNAALLVLAKTNVANLNDNGNSNNTTVTENNLNQFFSASQLQQWDQVYNGVIKKYDCAACHADIIKTSSKQTLSLFVNNSWIDTQKTWEEQLLWVKMTGAGGARIMPPSPSSNILSEKNRPHGSYQILQSWLMSL